MQESQTGAELPRYRSHKIVWALKIKSVEPDASAPRGAEGSCIITPEEPGYAPFRVSAEYAKKHNPQPGGYFVQYKDGYTSFSPAKAFEEGNTWIGTGNNLPPFIEIFQDGNMVCTLIGEDLMAGVAGFGPTTPEALRDLAANLEKEGRWPLQVFAIPPATDL